MPEGDIRVLGGTPQPICGRFLYYGVTSSAVATFGMAVLVAYVWCVSFQRHVVGLSGWD